MGKSMRVPAEEILKIFEANKDKYASYFEKAKTAPPVIIKEEENLEDASLMGQVDIDIICPVCGRHDTGLRSKWNRYGTCYCGYSFQQNTVYGLTNNDPDGQCSRDINTVLYIDNKPDYEVIVSTLNKTVYQYKNGKLDKVDINFSPYAIAYIANGKKNVYLKNNDEEWEYKNINLYPTFYRYTSFAVVIQGSTVKEENHHYQLLRNIYKAPVKQSPSNSGPVTIPVRNIEIQELTGMAIRAYSYNSSANEYSCQIWCTSCNEVFDTVLTENYSGFTVKCPHCGKEETFRQRFIRNSCTDIVDVSEDSDNIYVVLISANIDNNWAVNATAQRACVIDKKTGRSKHYAWCHNSKQWKENTTKYGMNRWNTKVFISDDLEKRTGIKKFEEKARGVFYNFDVIERYAAFAVKCPDAVDLMKYDTFKKDIAKYFIGRDRPFDINLRKTSFKEIFGVSKETYETVLKTNGSFELWAVRELDKFNISEETLTYIISKAVEPNVIVRLAKANGLDMDCMTSYIEKVETEQGIPANEAVRFWERYLTACRTLETENPELYPDNLASDMYRQEMKVTQKNANEKE